MKPKIDGTQFGSITIDGSDIEHDVLIRPGYRARSRRERKNYPGPCLGHRISFRLKRLSTSSKRGLNGLSLVQATMAM
ncbi:hypothetical protein [Nitrosomonas sp. Nm58]|uniref:hypothetical protein n=1 Tax=Nitrosomonas sp. Nm58 TaxID=200126 RepID=UPI0008972471|nr:hypothetical protein [Nitrosomonas sp. Nm58]SDY13521.1 hypothetical protein SAMN05421754_100259 [Nitrosomonas sp. Nm58]